MIYEGLVIQKLGLKDNELFSLRRTNHESTREEVHLGIGDRHAKIKFYHTSMNTSFNNVQIERKKE